MRNYALEKQLRSIEDGGYPQIGVDYNRKKSVRLNYLFEKTERQRLSPYAESVLENLKRERWVY